MKVQVLGICRFSFLVEGGFQVTHDTLDDRRRLLYDTDRLTLRFVWFERVCLPAWAKQTDPDFKLVILTGKDFPQPFLDRLRDVTAAIPQIVIEQEGPGTHRDVCRAVIHRHIDPAATVVAQFRHDDDDAVAVDYVARTRSDFLDKLRPMYRAHPLLSVDYSKGMTLAAIDGKVQILPQMSYNLGVALTIYMRPGHRLSVLDYGHHRLAAKMPGVYFQDSVMFVRGKHGTNDSPGPLRTGYPWEMNQDDTNDILRDRFAIDLPGFRAAIAALPGSADRAP